ncbi:hypothetical protein HZA40_01205 [Candidatus Peregrinibacteria bacterium]|nr:hypothetical protein [Candidatus Peregrinibacteria bacterium]
MYELKLHKNLNTEKWKTYDTSQQILMIANEVNRLMEAIKRKQPKPEMDEIMERAFELIDLTVECSGKKSFTRELLRWRELFAAYYSTDEKKEDIASLYKVLLLTSPTAFNLLYSLG